jgi:hypothetical protein
MTETIHSKIEKKQLVLSDDILGIKIGGQYKSSFNKPNISIDYSDE